jgi:hypothetical protein
VSCVERDGPRSKYKRENMATRQRALYIPSKVETALACLFRPFFIFLHNQSKRGGRPFIFQAGQSPSFYLLRNGRRLNLIWSFTFFLVMLSMTEIQFQFFIFFFFLGLAQSIDRNQKKGTDISLFFSFVIGFELRDPPAAPPCPREHWRRNHSIHHQWCRPRCG